MLPKALPGTAWEAKPLGGKGAHSSTSCAEATDQHTLFSATVFSLSLMLFFLFPLLCQGSVLPVEESDVSIPEAIMESLKPFCLSRENLSRAEFKLVPPQAALHVQL